MVQCKRKEKDPDADSEVRILQQFKKQRCESGMILFKQDQLNNWQLLSVPNRLQQDFLSILRFSKKICK